MNPERTQHQLACARSPSGKDVPMRSTLEARWGNFFTRAGFEWEYEPHTFDLSDGGSYTPDFFVKNLGWVECKPTLAHIKESWPRMKRFLAEHCEQKRGSTSKLYVFINSRPPLTLGEIALFHDGKIYKPNAHKMGAILLDALGLDETCWPQINGALRASSDERANRMMPIRDILRYELDRLLLPTDGI